MPSIQNLVFPPLFVLSFAAPLLFHDWSSERASQHAPATPVIWPIPDNDIAARKARFINKLVPAIHQVNQRILQDRHTLDVLIAKHATGRLTDEHKAWLKQQGDTYKMPAADPIDQQWLATLQRRMDIIPTDLSLAQGAMESAWGTSRFAEQANNYFGIWCFSPGCGIVPEKRPEGATHEVAAFRSLESNVAYYMNNLNTHPAYQSLRIIREQQRHEGEPVTGLSLAEGLLRYSQIGEEYVHKIQTLIRSNELDRFGNTHQATPAAAPPGR